MTQPRKRGDRGDATRNRILDTAERLFAEHGFASVSLRTITSAARVNIAAVNYYFKSKDALFEAIFIRRVVPINLERLRLLEAAMAKPQSPAAAVEALVRAFVEPHLRLTHEFGPGGAAIMQFMGRINTEPNHAIERIVLKQYDPVWWRFAEAMQKILPQLDKAAIYWRFYYMLGTLYYVTSARTWLPTRSENLCDPGDPDSVLAHIVPFLVGAFKADPPPRDPPKVAKSTAKPTAKPTAKTKPKLKPGA